MTDPPDTSTVVAEPAVTAETAIDTRAVETPVSQVEVSCQDKRITFHAGAGSQSYPLSSCDVPAGQYVVGVRADGKRIALDFDALPSGSGFKGPGDFSEVARLMQGQPRVSLVVTDPAAPEPPPPDPAWRIVEEPPAETPPPPPAEPPLAVTPQEAAELARAGELLEVAPGQRLNVKTFPLLLTLDWWRSRRAPLFARPDGDDVVVHQPFRVLQDPFFAADTATLPRSVFTDQLRVRGDELIQVRVHDGDSTRLVLMTGRQLLAMSERSADAARREMGLVALEVLSFGLPTTRFEAWIARQAVGLGGWARRTALGLFLGLAEIDALKLRVGTELITSSLRLWDEAVELAPRAVGKAFGESVEAVAPRIVTETGLELAERTIPRAADDIAPALARPIAIGGRVLETSAARAIVDGWPANLPPRPVPLPVTERLTGVPLANYDGPFSPPLVAGTQGIDAVREALNPRKEIVTDIVGWVLPALPRRLAPNFNEGWLDGARHRERLQGFDAGHEIGPGLGDELSILRAHPSDLNRYAAIRQAEIAFETLRNWALVEKVNLLFNKRVITHPIDTVNAGRGYYFTRSQRWSVDVVWPDGVVEREVLTVEVDIGPPRWLTDPAARGAALEAASVRAAGWLVPKLGQRPGRAELGAARKLVDD